jgi:DEAD/DEAH box helicase domain-containing protein
MPNLEFDFSGAKSGPLVLDVETQYLSNEVPGGWNAVDKFLVAVVVTWDEKYGMRQWFEEDCPKLLTELRNFSPIVTFNGDNFDFKVLSAYGPVDFLYAKSADMLPIISKKLGFRIKLETLAQATLGVGKTGSGTESVEWWRSGDPAQRQRVVDYCKKDVEITRDLYLFGKKNGYVVIEDFKSGGRRQVNVSW